jgi:hypothetical protein
MNSIASESLGRIVGVLTAPQCEIGQPVIVPGRHLDRKIVKVHRLPSKESEHGGYGVEDQTHPKRIGNNTFSESVPTKSIPARLSLSLVNRSVVVNNKVIGETNRTSFIPFQRDDHGLNVARAIQIIIVQSTEVFPVRPPVTRAKIGRGSERRNIPNIDNPIIRDTLNDTAAVVVRAVIVDNYLQLSVCLAQHRLKSGLQHGRTVIA